MVYLHNFYLNPMFDPSGPRPGADAHNCTVGYVSEYKPPSLYPGVNLTTINDGDGFAQVPHPGLPRETPLVLAANTHADEGGQTPVVFCQIFVGRFGVSFSPFERLFLGRFGFGQSCGLSVIA